ncbi:neuropeptide CCHamide 1 isoform X2 [Anticarsia gemmatalis]|uniref:neuropeptide CCHamide 1 isoform X2 n=1 Tax=Anticarsia gemmatalis TaxID=129554 RepID=UPI003F765C08
MDRKASRTSRSASAVTKIFALLLVICLVECATGSCLSYGHSCWGAHGKRSGKPPGSAPDWYLTRLLRRMAANAELNRVKQLATKNDDIDAIYQLNMQDDSSANNKMIVDNDEGPMELPLSGNMEAKPMLDDDLLSKMKLWQIMRESPEEK